MFSGRLQYAASIHWRASPVVSAPMGLQGFQVRRRPREDRKQARRTSLCLVSSSATVLIPTLGTIRRYAKNPAAAIRAIVRFRPRERSVIVIPAEAPVLERPWSRDHSLVRQLKGVWAGRCCALQGQAQAASELQRCPRITVLAIVRLTQSAIELPGGLQTRHEDRRSYRRALRTTATVTSNGASIARQSRPLLKAAAANFAHSCTQRFDLAGHASCD